MKIIEPHQFIIRHGIHLSTHIGVDEFALLKSDALKALQMLQEHRIPVLGGDVYCNDNGKIKYTYDNWYCDRENNENNDEYALRSIINAKYFIENYTLLGNGSPIFVLVC